MTERTSNVVFPGWSSVALIALSLIMLGWCFGEYRSAQKSYQQATEDLRESQDLGAQINQWIAKPTVASLSTDTSLEHTRQLTNSLKEAKISASSILSISPSEITRVGQSDYQQRQTIVALQEVSMQVLATLQTALDERNGLYLEDLVLTPSDRPMASNGTENWDARLTLTQLVYSPTSE